VRELIVSFLFAITAEAGPLMLSHAVTGWCGVVWCGVVVG
jgi:hypothetical protein